MADLDDVVMNRKRDRWAASARKAEWEGMPNPHWETVVDTTGGWTPAMNVTVMIRGDRKRDVAARLRELCERFSTEQLVQILPTVEGARAMLRGEALLPPAPGKAPILYPADDAPDEELVPGDGFAIRWRPGNAMDEAAERTVVRGLDMAAIEAKAQSDQLVRDFERMRDDIGTLILDLDTEGILRRKDDKLLSDKIAALTASVGERLRAIEQQQAAMQRQIGNLRTFSTR